MEAKQTLSASFVCSQCGWCCKYLYFYLEDDDLQKWTEMYIDGVSPNPIEDGYVSGDDIMWKDGFFCEKSKGWEGPYRPNGEKSCPYLMYQPHLKKFICRLHNIGAKPGVCERFQPGFCLMKKIKIGNGKQ